MSVHSETYKRMRLIIRGPDRLDFPADGGFMSSTIWLWDPKLPHGCAGRPAVRLNEQQITVWLERNGVMVDVIFPVYALDTDKPYPVITLEGTKNAREVGWAFTQVDKPHRVEDLAADVTLYSKFLTGDLFTYEVFRLARKQGNARRVAQGMPPFHPNIEAAIRAGRRRIDKLSRPFYVRVLGRMNSAIAPLLVLHKP